MPVNSTKTHRWKEDIRKSVDMYNDWFLRFAPKAYRDTRARTTETVKKAMATTRNLRDLGADTLRTHPEVLSVLRMATCPPLAVDRLIGLAGVPALWSRPWRNPADCHPSCRQTGSRPS